MIQKNYIILTHNNPDQLSRLINRLHDNYSHFYVHIDKKVSLELFSNIQNLQHVTIIKNRELCIWGDFSLVQATINCMKEIIADKRNYHTVLLSGQCYPIVSNLEIDEYLTTNSEFNHIDIKTISEVWGDRSLQRINSSKIDFSSKKGDFITLPYFFGSDFMTIAKCLAKLIKVSIEKKKFHIFLFLKTFKKRKSININPYAGSQWWALNYETLNKTLNFLDKNSDFIDFYKNVVVPDEIFFQTIIKHLSLTNEEIRIKPSFTYVNWNREGISSPVLFNKNDFEEILKQRKSGKLFARKFDSDNCENILNLIDDSST